MRRKLVGRRGLSDGQCKGKRVRHACIDDQDSRISAGDASPHGLKRLEAMLVADIEATMDCGVMMAVGRMLQLSRHKLYEQGGGKYPSLENFLNGLLSDKHRWTGGGEKGGSWWSRRGA